MRRRKANNWARYRNAIPVNEHVRWYFTHARAILLARAPLVKTSRHHVSSCVRLCVFSGCMTLGLRQRHIDLISCHW
ncbi:hypothetical protein BDW69DRAFT_79847 [Aspergillus filifer]